MSLWLKKSKLKKERKENITSEEEKKIQQEKKNNKKERKRKEGKFKKIKLIKKYTCRHWKTQTGADIERKMSTETLTYKDNKREKER